MSILHLHTPTSPARGTTTTIRVTGEVDASTAPALEAALSTLVEAGCSQVDVDLSDVTFLACAGVSALLVARCRAEAAGVPLRVVDPSEPASRALDLTWLRSYLASPAD